MRVTAVESEGGMWVTVELSKDEVAKELLEVVGVTTAGVKVTEALVELKETGDDEERTTGDRVVSRGALEVDSGATVVVVRLRLQFYNKTPSLINESMS